MDHFLDYAVNFFRSKLQSLMEKELSSYDDLHSIVHELLDLQEEFEGLLDFIEDLERFHLSL